MNFLTVIAIITTGIIIGVTISSIKYNKKIEKMSRLIATHQKEIYNVSSKSFKNGWDCANADRQNVEQRYIQMFVKQR